MAFQSKEAVSKICEPDKSERSIEAVDCKFNLGSRCVVLEHSQTESYEDQIPTDKRWNRFFSDLQKRLAGNLPTDGAFEMRVDWALVNFPEKTMRATALDALEEWTLSVAPTLKTALRHRFDAGTFRREIPQGLGAEVLLWKRSSSQFNGQSILIQIAPDFLEQRRQDRISKLLRDKLPKLQGTKSAEAGSISVLLIESDDIALGNSAEIQDALMKAIADSDFVGMIPDEIYLIETDIENSWAMYKFRTCGVWIIDDDWYVYKSGKWKSGE